MVFLLSELVGGDDDLLDAPVHERFLADVLFHPAAVGDTCGRMIAMTPSSFTY